MATGKRRGNSRRFKRHTRGAEPPYRTSTNCHGTSEAGGVDEDGLGIDEDLRPHVPHVVLDVIEGAVLECAIQRLPGTSLKIVSGPCKRPDPHRLGLTLEEFVGAHTGFPARWG